MSVQLFKDLARSGWHSSIMTTYSVDPAFYDGSIEYRLRNYGCENNILMADAVMLKHALNATPEAFRNAGRRYAIVPVLVTGAFHPKVHLRLGTKGGRLVIGSANATAKGWGSNHEVVAAINWELRSEDAITPLLGPLIRRCYDYLAYWLESVEGDAIALKLQLHHRHSPWLYDLEANDRPIALPDGSAIDILYERSQGDPGMLERLVELCSGEKPSRLVVISPYWDSKLDGLRNLQQSLSECQTVVALNPTSSEFPVNALKAGPQIKFCPIFDRDEAHRFLHAKLILVETNRADHVLFGSANCSDDAMGSLSDSARNAEVSMYRRFPRGTTLQLLGLDLSRSIDASAIRLPQRRERASSRTPVPAGVFELIERELTWWPPPNVNSDGATILATGTSLSTTAIGNGQFRASLETDPAFPLVVRVQFQDGRMSDPAIVHDDVALQLSSPGVTDRRLKNAFDRVLRGEDDIIDLARQAHLLFATPDDGVGNVRRIDQANKQPKKFDYATPQEFREGVRLKPATGQSGRFATRDPGMLDLLAVVLRGLVDVGGREARRRLDQEEIDDLDAGENEDGDESNDKTRPQKKDPGDPPSGHTPRTFTPAEIKRRKSSLKKTLDAFDTLLAKASKQERPVPTQLAAQVTFILELLFFACTKDYPKPDGTSVRLITFAPRRARSRDLTFAVRAGRILQVLWSDDWGSALATKLYIDPRHTSLPDDVFYLIVMSRLAIARAYIATIAIPKQGPLSKILQSTAIKIFQSSSKLGPLDEEAELTFVAKLDESLGFSVEETAELLQEYGHLATIARESSANRPGAQEAEKHIATHPAAGELSGRDA